MILKHFIWCVKKKACQTQDAEVLLGQSVINFQATNLEQSIIENRLKETLRTQMGMSNKEQRVSDLTD